MIRCVSIAFAFACMLLAACGGPSPTPPQTTQTDATATPLAAVLGAAVCLELDGRLFALASGADGVTDTFVLVKKCEAHAKREDVGVIVDAYAWIAVDRDFGAFGVHEFVHATVHGEVLVQAHARYADDRLELTLTPRSSTIAALPVGVLDLAPLNWASFLAIEVAPAAGASPEALAKTKLREEAERTLALALTKPIIVSYDARSGVASLGSALVQPQSSSNNTRARIVPHGTALVGPFPASSAASARMRVEPGHRVAMKAVCHTHAERILDADRRGDPVSTDDWIVVNGEDKARRTLGPMPCQWMIAVRAEDEAAAATIINIDVDAPTPGKRAVDVPDQWVSIDEVTLDASPPPLEDDIAIVAANDVWRRTILPHTKEKTKPLLPTVVVLAPDEQISLFAQRRGETVMIADARLPLETMGHPDTPTTVTLTTKDGRHVATVRVHTHVRHATHQPESAP